MNDWLFAIYTALTLALSGFFYYKWQNAEDEADELFRICEVMHNILEELQDEEKNS